MAAAGSVLGCVLLYSLRERAGKHSFTKRPAIARAPSVTGWRPTAFWECWSPLFCRRPLHSKFLYSPPVSSKFPLWSFTSAIALARAIRYFGVGYLAVRYGNQALPYLVQHKLQVVFFIRSLCPGQLPAFPPDPSPQTRTFAVQLNVAQSLLTVLLASHFFLHQGNLYLIPLILIVSTRFLLQTNSSFTTLGCASNSISRRHVDANSPAPPHLPSARIATSYPSCVFSTVAFGNRATLKNLLRRIRLLRQIQFRRRLRLVLAGRCFRIELRLRLPPARPPGRPAIVSPQSHATEYRERIRERPDPPR